MAWHILPLPVSVMPRVKTYSGSSGFVYQYQFTLHEPGVNGDRYYFATTQDRAEPFDVVVFLPREPVEAWEAQEARHLNATERYALAKMALFEAFDLAEEPGKLASPICIGADQVAAIVRTLDL